MGFFFFSSVLFALVGDIQGGIHSIQIAGSSEKAFTSSLLSDWRKAFLTAVDIQRFLVSLWIHEFCLTLAAGFYSGKHESQQCCCLGKVYVPEAGNFRKSL